MNVPKYLDKTILLLILGLYLLLALPLLNKEPYVFHDETFFVNYAYSLTGREKMSREIFATRLNLYVQENEVFPNYGPVFFTVLAVPLKIFGLTVASAFLTPVVLGLFCLIAAYYYSKSLLLTMLLATDPYFLEATRIIRPEILLTLFFIITCLFYSKKKYLLAALTIYLSLNTHPYLGSIITIGIFLHAVYTNKLKFIKSKEFFLLSLPVFVTVIYRFSLLFLQPGSLTRAEELVSQRTGPNLLTIVNNFLANADTKPAFQNQLLIITLLTFITHFLIFVSAIFLAKRSSQKSLWLILFIVSAVFIFFGGSTWYVPLFILSSYFCLIQIKKTALFFLTSVILFQNISHEALLISVYTKRDSYKDYSVKISEVIPPNSKVFLHRPSPDPWLYLAEKRPDLTIFSIPYSNHPKNYDQMLTVADYVILKKEDLLVDQFDKNTLPFLISLEKLLKDKEYRPIVIPYENNGKTGSVIIELNSF